MQPVLDYLRANRTRFINDLCDYVRFPSVSAQASHRRDMKAAATWLVARCRAIGLQASLETTSGNPVVVARTRGRRQRSSKPCFLVYGHYDVQPAEPFELWKSPPFEPRIANGSLFARGASDNKGQHLAHLNAVEAYLRTKTELPCDLTFVIEGEEEVGSKSLPEFLRRKRGELRCDAIVISDTGIPSLKHPAITYALRGITALEIILRGPSRDLHSGIYGGCVDNPAMALSQLLGRLRDANGRIAVPGFYSDVVPITRFQRRQMARIPHDEAAFRRFLGVPKMFGERGFTTNERRTARPTIEINGLTSGYQGEGGKTIVPAWASAKLTFRLVPNQDPRRITRAIEKHLRRLCPPTVRLEIREGHGAVPYLVSPESPVALAGLAALRKAFGHEPVLLREGGSIPIVTEFKKTLGADALMLGLALPDDNAHSPNEKFSLKAYERGMRMSAYLWPALAAAVQRSA